jgi:hypothetical protein
MTASMVAASSVGGPGRIVEFIGMLSWFRMKAETVAAVCDQTVIVALGSGENPASNFNNGVMIVF